MLYDYLLTFFKVIVGLITAERLIYIALCAFGVYLIWVICSLICSFQRKFYKNSVKMYNYLRNNQNNPNNVNFVDNFAGKISSGFAHGWKKFRKENKGKPSDYISRSEALDVEINGGVFNQGKSFMRAYIWFVVTIVFVLNFAFYGNSATITCYLIAESMMLPIILLFVLKIFYFLYTTVRQQLYKTDVEVFYDTIDLLDENFAGKQMPQMYSRPVVETSNDAKQPEVAVEQKSEEKIVEPENENTESQETEEETLAEENLKEETEKANENPLDAFDVFKKKNIDVNKLMNEVPSSSTSLPYINVDSDYVIKDDDKIDSIKKPLSGANNGSEVLGGMMQDMSSIKKSSNFIDVDKPVAKIDEEKLKTIDKETKDEQKSEENNITLDDPFESLGEFEVKKEESDDENKADLNVKPESSDNPPSLEAKDKDDSNSQKPLQETKDTENDKAEDLGTSESVTNSDTEKQNLQNDEVSKSEREEIANIVGGFRTKKSSLASGGMVIERNEPIARRERQTTVVTKPQAESEPEVNDEVNYLTTNDNADSVLNSLHGGFATSNDPFAMDYGSGYGTMPQNFATPSQNYSQGYGYGAGYGTMPQNNGYVNQNYSNMQSQPQSFGSFGGYNTGFNAAQQNVYDDSINDYNNFEQNFSNPQTDLIEEVAQEEYPEVEEVKTKPKAAVKTKARVEKQKSKSVKGEKQVEKQETAPTSKRGRPKKQVFDETLTIKNDKEFDEVLSRAEKLMRKSDEGLSQSQSKRIEKELKMLMDAMNRYKERR